MSTPACSTRVTIYVESDPNHAKKVVIDVLLNRYVILTYENNTTVGSLKSKIFTLIKDNLPAAQQCFSLKGRALEDKELVADISKDGLIALVWQKSNPLQAEAKE